MAARKGTSLGDHPVVITFLILAIIAAMALASEVLKPLALAVLLALALAPGVRWLEARGLPRALASLACVLIALGIVSGIGYVVGRQLTTLANDLPRYESHIYSKLDLVLKPNQQSAIQKAAGVASRVAEKLEGPGLAETRAAEVRIVEQTSFRQRLEQAVGPYLEPMTVGLFVLVLTVFILINREDLVDRIVGLFGHKEISLTTKTTGEIGTRISRYLATFAAVNSAYGCVVGIGLALLGVPYALLWGVLAAVLRFIPYVGPAIAVALPTLFTIAYTPEPSWGQPLAVLGMFAVFELLATYTFEPIIYGRTTGVSALGLLIAAMFWTWLWGVLGLLLSTPLTVCLAVLGKYVPRLSFFATLLGEEADLTDDVRFYQRLLALDQDGAIDLIENLGKQIPRAEICDQVLIPTLARTERDFERGDIEERERAFAWRVVEEVLEEWEGSPTLTLASVQGQADAEGSPTVRVLGIATHDRADEIVLRMLGQKLEETGASLTIVERTETADALIDAIEDHESDLVVISHLPPQGLTSARRVVRRIRKRFPELPILVGRWGEFGKTDQVNERLRAAGADRVEFTVGAMASAVSETAASVAPTEAQPAGRA